MMSEKRKKIVYVQYTNPGGYPPLEYSSHILANRDWKVVFLGTKSEGGEQLAFKKHLNVQVMLLPFQRPGFFQKLHYLMYCLWGIMYVLIINPRWVYVSDTMACPLATILARMGFAIIYHEHDSPNIGCTPTLLNKLLLGFRREVANKARLCVLPNQKRAEIFLKQIGSTHVNVSLVWNCPSVVWYRNIVTSSKTRCENSFIVLYQGSIVPDRLPVTVILALCQLPPMVKLKIIGYETSGSKGYKAALMTKARALGVEERVQIIQAVNHSDLFDISNECHVGLALMPKTSTDVNMINMTGASNKPFEYMACGLPILVSDKDDWHDMFVCPGYGLSCDPDSVDSIAQSLMWFVKHPAERAQMGEAAQRKIYSDWNYDQKFSQVVDFIEREG